MARRRSPVRMSPFRSAARSILIGTKSSSFWKRQRLSDVDFAAIDARLRSSPISRELSIRRPERHIRSFCRTPGFASSQCVAGHGDGAA